MNKLFLSLAFFVSLCEAYPLQYWDYAQVICPYVTTAINYYFGTRDNCICSNEPTLFYKKIPFFRFGIDTNCSYTKPDGLDISVDLTFRGGFVDTAICHEIDASTTACFYGSYFLEPDWVFTFNHIPQSCKVEVNGQKCSDCAFIGKPPISAMAWDCGSLLPADFDFNQKFPNEDYDASGLIAEAQALLGTGMMMNSTDTRQKTGKLRR
jgi:hypothetical protein